MTTKIEGECGDLSSAPPPVEILDPNWAEPLARRELRDVAQTPILLFMSPAYAN